MTFKQLNSFTFIVPAASFLMMTSSVIGAEAEKTPFSQLGTPQSVELLCAAVKKPSNLPKERKEKGEDLLLHAGMFKHAGFKTTLLQSVPTYLFGGKGSSHDAMSWMQPAPNCPNDSFIQDLYAGFRQKTPYIPATMETQTTFDSLVRNHTAAAIFESYLVQESKERRAEIERALLRYGKGHVGQVMAALFSNNPGAQLNLIGDFTEEELSKIPEVAQLKAFYPDHLLLDVKLQSGKTASQELAAVYQKEHPQAFSRYMSFPDARSLNDALLRDIALNEGFASATESPYRTTLKAAYSRSIREQTERESAMCRKKEDLPQNPYLMAYAIASPAETLEQAGTSKADLCAMWEEQKNAPRNEMIKQGILFAGITAGAIVLGRVETASIAAARVVGVTEALAAQAMARAAAIRVGWAVSGAIFAGYGLVQYAGERDRLAAAEGLLAIELASAASVNSARRAYNLSIVNMVAGGLLVLPDAFAAMKIYREYEVYRMAARNLAGVRETLHSPVKAPEVETLWEEIVRRSGVGKLREDLARCGLVPSYAN